MLSTHKGRSEIIAAIPLLLGFQPRESLVVLGRRDVGLYTAACHSLEARDAIALTALAMYRHGIQYSLIVGYSCGDGLAAAIATAYKELTKAEIDVNDILIVLDGRWIGLGDTTPKGHPMPVSGGLASRLANDGYKVRATKHVTTAEVAPVSVHRRTEVSSHLDGLFPYFPENNSTIADDAQRLIDNATSQSYPGYEDTAILVAAAWDSRIRMHAMDAISGTDPPNAHLDLWTWVTRHASGPDIAAPAVLAAAAAHVCARDERAAAFAQAAMTAAIGWPSALLAANVVDAFGKDPGPPDPPPEEN